MVIAGPFRLLSYIKECRLYCFKYPQRPLKQLVGSPVAHATLGGQHGVLKIATIRAGNGSFIFIPAGVDNDVTGCPGRLLNSTRAAIRGTHDAMLLVSVGEIVQLVDRRDFKTATNPCSLLPSLLPGNTHEKVSYEVGLVISFSGQHFWFL
jgi:hypothetical protein